MSARILGFSGGFSIGNRDVGTALVDGGRLVAVAHEERYSRVKKSAGHPMPTFSLDWTLKSRGLSLADVDVVATHGATFIDHERRVGAFLRDRYGHAPPLAIFDHHLCHAASAYLLSGYPRALIVTADFVGDGCSGLVALGEGSQIVERQRFPFPASLGVFYGLVTQFLGFELGEDEYKVMGLAAYGKDPVDLGDMLRVEGGRYDFTREYMAERPAGPARLNQENWFSPKMIEHLGPPRRPGTEITQRHKDVALGAQRLLERVACQTVRHAIEVTGERKVCLAGGVALNVLMNQALREMPEVESVFVPPFAADDGIGVGAALLAAASRGMTAEPLGSPYLGSTFTDADIEASLKKAGIPYARPESVAASAAEAIAQGEIIGWFQGASECGPRALGNRSILADPRRAEMKDRVNEVIKYRESFRPFAPAVLDENGAAYFEDYRYSPYMNMTFRVREPMRSVIPAVTHADGTARVQSVRADVNPLFHQLIRELATRTGVEVVLNTSFNVKGQPIVDSPLDALGTFFMTGMSRLFLGPFMITKDGFSR